MNRRGFLRMLGLAAPVAAVAPTYLFAPVGGWKSPLIHNPFEVGEALFFLDDVKAATLEELVGSAAYDNFFVSTPFRPKIYKNWIKVDYGHS